VSEEKEKGQRVTDSPREGESSQFKYLPFTVSDVARAIYWRRAAFITKKSGFTLYWDAYHGNFVALGRGEKLDNWYMIKLYHWTESQLEDTTDLDFMITNDHLYYEYKHDKTFNSPCYTFKNFLAIKNRFDERFEMWLARRIRLQGLVKKWEEEYAKVIKKVPEWAPSLNKVDLL